MIGFEAIAHYNGWAMAGFGALIVASGLAVLSFVISQLHKIAEMMEKKKIEPAAEAPLEAKPEVIETLPAQCPADLENLCGAYKSVTEKTGETFPLPELFDIAKELNLPHPHLSIKCFREAGLLIPLGDGIFRWKE